MLRVNIKLFFALLAGRGVRRLSRLLNKGGTDMPGRVALKICPELLELLSRDVTSVAVTGTNGKTTTSRMIEQAFRDRGLAYFANRSGANLSGGVATEFIMNASLTGRPKKQYAILECDEAAAVGILPRVRPRVLLVTNLFREQLDRYGEVTHTLENIRKAAAGAPEAVLCLNADCSLTASLALELPNPVVWYGIDRGALPEREKPELSDAMYCIRCKTEYEYDYITYGHLGGFRCPACGYRRQDADFAVTELLSEYVGGSDVTMRFRDRTARVKINMPAIYNLYNAVAAAAAVCAMGMEPQDAAGALGRFRGGFGRMEGFPLGKGGSRMMLVKNPAGCNQVLEFLGSIPEDFSLVLALNDRSQDGTDISWVWDVNYELLAAMGDRLEGVIVTGDRTSELHMRIKYAGVPEEKLREQRDYAALVEELREEQAPVFILPTYTAMLELRTAVIRAVGGAEFWE